MNIPIYAYTSSKTNVQFVYSLMRYLYKWVRVPNRSNLLLETTPKVADCRIFTAPKCSERHIIIKLLYS